MRRAGLPLPRAARHETSRHSRRPGHVQGVCGKLIVRTWLRRDWLGSARRSVAAVGSAIIGRFPAIGADHPAAGCVGTFDGAQRYIGRGWRGGDPGWGAHPPALQEHKMPRESCLACRLRGRARAACPVCDVCVGAVVLGLRLWPFGRPGSWYITVSQP